MTSSRAVPERRWRSIAVVTAIASCALALAACGPTKFEAELNVPPPLVSQIPIEVGVYVPEEFSNRVYEEKRRDYSISVSIGKAQSDGFKRLMNAMFLRAIPVQGTSAASITGPEMRAIFEPVLEDFGPLPDDVSAARKLADLPAGVRRYLDRIEGEVGVPLALVSVGPGRQESIRI